MRVLSLDLRERILAACDAGGQTREQVALRFAVSLGMVKKLLAQRRRTGDIAARYHLCGRQPKILKTHYQRLRILVRRQPDLTLAELRAALALKCSPVAIHYALVKLELTYKKRHCAPANRAAPTSPGHAVPGGAASGRAVSRQHA
jgi:transposase